MREDYQKAVSEVGAAHDSFATEAQQVQTLLKQRSPTVASSESTVAPSVTTSPTAAPALSGKISINRATASQLDGLPGIGPAYAQRIVDYRTEHGPFKKIDDLDQVSGIGPATIEKIRDLIEL